MAWCASTHSVKRIKRSGGPDTVDYANPAALVSTDWVAEHLHDPSIRLVEVDVDTTTYERGHLEGAVGLNWTTQFGDPIRRDIPTRDAWQGLMRRCGVDNTTRIVFYGDNNNVAGWRDGRAHSNQTAPRPLKLRSRARHH
jgi:hypothetical protein